MLAGFERVDNRRNISRKVCSFGCDTISDTTGCTGRSGADASAHPRVDGARWGGSPFGQSPSHSTT